VKTINSKTKQFKGGSDYYILLLRNVQPGTVVHDYNASYSEVEQSDPKGSEIIRERKVEELGMR
jgi:hypothetical protein